MGKEVLLDKQTKINYFFVIISEVITVITPLIVAPYLARVLGKSNIGIFDFVVSNSSYFIIFAQLGLDVYGQREIARVGDNRSKRSSVLKRVQTLRACTFCISMFIYSIFILFAGKEFRLFYYIYMLYFLGVAFDITWFYRGIENFKLVTYRNIAIKIATLICVFAFVHSPEDLWKYFIIYSVSILCSNISLYFGLQKYIDWSRENPFVNIRKDLLESASLFIPQIAIIVSVYFDKTIAGIVCGVEEVAYYSQADKIVNVLLTVVTAFSSIMLSKNSKLLGGNNSDQIGGNVSFSIELAATIAAPMVSGILIVSKYFIPIYYGAGYEKSIIILEILAFILFISGITDVFGRQYFTAIGEQRYYSISLFVSMLVNVGLNLAIIPILGSIGAAITTVVSQGICLLTLIFFVRKKISIRFIFSQIYKPIVAAIVMNVVLNILDANLFGKVNNLLILLIELIIGVLVYMVSNIALKNRILFSFLKKN